MPFNEFVSYTIFFMACFGFVVVNVVMTVAQLNKNKAKKMRNCTRCIRCSECNK
jgi:hypothetical protein